MTAFFDLPLNIPHAATVAWRIPRVMASRGWADEPWGEGLLQHAGMLEQRLSEYRHADDNPDSAEAEEVCQEAADLARTLVAEMERAGVGDDRVGQCIRNLFECLGMGREGAEISLRAGESPNSPQRPV
jgi:hypothetical protein